MKNQERDETFFDWEMFAFVMVQPICFRPTDIDRSNTTVKQPLVEVNL